MQSFANEISYLEMGRLTMKERLGLTSLAVVLCCCAIPVCGQDPTTADAYHNDEPIKRSSSQGGGNGPVAKALSYCENSCGSYLSSCGNTCDLSQTCCNCVTTPLGLYVYTECRCCPYATQCCMVSTLGLGIDSSYKCCPRGSVCTYMGCLSSRPPPEVPVTEKPFGFRSSAGVDTVSPSTSEKLEFHEVTVDPTWHQSSSTSEKLELHQTTAYPTWHQSSTQGDTDADADDKNPLGNVKTTATSVDCSDSCKQIGKVSCECDKQLRGFESRCTCCPEAFMCCRNATQIGIDRCNFYCCPQGTFCSATKDSSCLPLVHAEPTAGEANTLSVTLTQTLAGTIMFFLINVNLIIV